MLNIQIFNHRIQESVGNMKQSLLEVLKITCIGGCNLRLPKLIVKSVDNVRDNLGSLPDKHQEQE